SLITLIINYFFIPRFSYMACAWATFSCYGSMMVVSYIWGQKYYKIPYATKKLLGYISISVALYGVHELINRFNLGIWLDRGISLILLGIFLVLIINIEKKEIQKLPYIGRFI